MSTGRSQKVKRRMELLQQVRIIDPAQQVDRFGDILLEGDQIKSMGDRLTDYPAETTIIPSSGLILGTGLVDLYSHSGEPGNETRESLAELAQAAANGGFTQVGILPDTVPPLDNLEVIAALQHKSSLLHLSETQFNLPRLNFWGSAWNEETKKMNGIGELQSAIVGLVSSHHLGNLDIFRQILEYVQPWQKTLAIALQPAQGVVREGAVSIRYGMSGNPGSSEAAAIAAIVEIAREIPHPVHLMRVSTERGVELIAEAKSRGINITASTTWMHLLWSDHAVGSYDPNLRLEPALGSESDRQSLSKGVKQGIIDAIAIDHQAYTYEEKTVAFALAPPGVIGLEFALPLLWQKFVATGEWSALELWQALSSRPRQCLQQQVKAIAPAQAVDLVLFDSEKTWTCTQNHLKSPAANTVWYDQEITGKVIKTWTNNC
ncbi:MAG: dihydroorotase [Cyanobacteria bacterium P01_C01_bin.72]